MANEEELDGENGAERPVIRTSITLVDGEVYEFDIYEPDEGTMASLAMVSGALSAKNISSRQAFTQMAILMNDIVGGAIVDPDVAVDLQGLLARRETTPLDLIRSVSGTGAGQNRATRRATARQQARRGTGAR